MGCTEFVLQWKSNLVMSDKHVGKTRTEAELSKIDNGPPALWFPNVLPPELSGVYGLNRQSNPHVRSQIEADDDLTAIEQWLKLNAHNTNTKRSYRKEAYRLALWSTAILGRPVSSLSTDDLDAFQAWAVRPIVPDAWIDENWRVINADGLSKASLKQTMRILRTMFDWFCDAGYLSGNPFRLIKSKNDVKNDIDTDAARGVERFLDEDIWEWLTTFPDILQTTAQDRLAAEVASGKLKRARRNLWPTERCERIRFILVWLYRTAARRAELASNSSKSIVRNPHGDWIWWVTGKGGTVLAVTLDPEAIAAAARYRRTRELPAYPVAGEDTPIVAGLDRKSWIDDSVIYRELKAFFKEAKAYIERTDPSKEIWLPKIAKASTHWLRHTRASHLALSGAKPKSVQDQLRHSSPSTTAKYYVHESQTARMEDLAEADRVLKQRMLLRDKP
jgi:integrase